MKLALYTEPLPPQFHWDPRNPVRGTEEFYVETARCLVALGHDVTVFYDGGALFPGGVRYNPRSEYRGGFDAVLCCNTPPPAQVPGTRHVYWSDLWGDKHERHGWAEEQIVISRFHRGHYEAPPSSDVREPAWKTHVIGLGVDGEKYRSDGRAKLPVALYSSSMDRGGVWLQANWASFNTGLELVCSGGGLSDERMTELYRTSAVWLHPGMGVELFCLSARKAQAAGCLCVYAPNMALPETIGEGHIALPSYRWRKELAGALKAQPTPRMYRVHPTWTEVTKELEAVLCPIR